MEVEDVPDLESIVMSHEKRLAEQEKRSNNQGERLNHHEIRLNEDKKAIQELKKFDQSKHERLLIVEENIDRIEKIVEKENEETRSTMREQTEKLFQIVEQAMGYQETRTKQTHELRMTRWNTLSTVFLKVSGGIVALLSSGGAIYFLIEKFILE